MNTKKVMLGAGVFLVGATILSRGALGLTYQDEVEVEFTFDPMISVSLSDADLLIDGLVPGTADKSNTIVVNVTTNNSYGYTLSASVGDGVTYQNSNLTNSVGGTPFSSLGTSDDVTLANFQNNNWGYTLASSIDDTTTYSGLPYGSEKVINSTKNLSGGANTGYLGGNSTNFTIGAKAPTGQVAGDYTNVINFVAIVNPKPRYMQDAASWRNEVANIGDHVEDVIDTRDGKTYNVARLADNKVWMTTNLDLTGGTALYSDDSDVAPANTRASGTPYYTLPTSATSGFSDNTVAYVYNSNNRTGACTSANKGCYSYYSWLAATAGGKNTSGAAVTSNGSNAAYSICPAGWRLPTSTTSNASPQTSPNWKTGDFYALATAYGANLEGNYSDSSSTSTTGGNFNTNAGPTSTLPKFLLGGDYNFSSFGNGDSYGYYWSATSYTSSYAYSLYFGSSSVGSANRSDRRDGFSVRCILR